MIAAGKEETASEPFPKARRRQGKATKRPLLVKGDILILKLGPMLNVRSTAFLQTPNTKNVKISSLVSGLMRFALCFPHW